MEAKELRIGNWVTENGRLIHIHDGFGIDHAYNFEPIPLTEDWLLKFGFELKNWGIKVWYLKGFEIDQNFYLKGIDWGVRFKYVHQLQNLYFALTNEELEFTPIPQT